MNSSANPEPEMARARKWALLLGVAGLLTCLAGALRDPTQFFRSYLLAYVFWIGIPLGCIAIVMLHHLTGGGWGFGIRRLLEAGGDTFPLMTALFVPLTLGLPRLYLWAQPMAVAADPVLRYKRPYLNTPFFLGRSVAYFLVWIALAYALNKWSAEQDRTAEAGLTRRLEALSGPGLVLYGLTVTFAAVDWVMSVEPRFFSTIYGMMFVVAQALAALAFVIVVAHHLAGRPPLSEVVTPMVLNDLGSFLLTFVMLWAYLSFSQFLIIWSGNLRDEIPWYTSRASGGWAAFAVMLIVLHFGLPFLLLLSRGVKRRTGVLAGVAAGLLVLGFADVFWLLVPGFEPHRPRLHWADLAAVVGIGGVWIAAFLASLQRRPLLPLHDPRFEGATTHGN